MIVRLIACGAAMILAAGCGMPSFLVTPVSSSTELKEEVVQSGGGGWGASKIAIIEVEGLLLNMKSGGLLQPQENDVSRFTQQLAKAEKESSVKAVVLRVNSPGGTVAASDAMYEQVIRFRQRCHKPVVAMAQDVAASGAYYVSCGADKIVVQPTSVVGSIGVIFETFDFSGTLDKIGAKSDAIKSGPLKDMGSPFRPLGPAERAVMQGMVDEFYVRFKEVVQTNRHLDTPRLTEVSDGRVFTGEKAVELGLADQSGMLTDAIELAKQLAHVQSADVILYKRPYGYGGSIYARDAVPAPQANVMELRLTPEGAFLPTGFYYLWRPGR